jgi:hypothetical protein
VDGIAAIGREVFGPVLHVATYAAADLPAVLEAINATGSGLTFGVHSRIDDRVQRAVDGIHAGNVYVNRNQIGAVVGSQPFGGEGLSGTGPKAGGPHYLPRFGAPPVAPVSPREMPGPTGESNRLTLRPRGPVLCLGPDRDAQAAAVRALGGQPVTGDLDPARPARCRAVVGRRGGGAAARGAPRRPRRPPGAARHRRARRGPRPLGAARLRRHNGRGRQRSLLAGIPEARSGVRDGLMTQRRRQRTGRRWMDSIWPS